MTIDSSPNTPFLDDNIKFCILFQLRVYVTNNLLDHVGVTENIAFSASEVSDNLQCYHLTKSPTAVDWTTTYRQDSSTSVILDAFTNSSKPVWSKDRLAKVDLEYRSHLVADRVQLLHGKLVQYKPIFKYVKYVGLIIVPLSLRRVIFSYFHAGPTGGHMGKYKTLFRICMRFIWPGTRRDTKLWVKQCSHCCAYNVWRNRKSEFYFSRPVTTPFYIMHVDLWIPGKLVDSQGNTLRLMNVMCDLTQFVVSMLVTEATAELLGNFLWNRLSSILVSLLLWL